MHVDPKKGYLSAVAPRLCNYWSPVVTFPCAQELQKRSILTDIISYLKPASTSEMRYIRMLCDLCCLTYKVRALRRRRRGLQWHSPLASGNFHRRGHCRRRHPLPQFDKLTPSALNRLHRLVLITTSRACDLPLFKQPDSPEGIFVDADGMCSVPVPGSASSGPPSQLATAAGSPRGASPLLGTTSRRAVDVTSETGASGESAVSEKILEAQHAADLASLPINALVGAAGLAGSAISSTGAHGCQVGDK